jgi:transcriptional regulator with XRE-family HTH domain
MARKATVAEEGKSCTRPNRPDDRKVSAFGTALRELREKRNWSQEDAEGQLHERFRRLAVERKAISSLENGHTMPRLDVFIGLLMVYGAERDAVRLLTLALADIYPEGSDGWAWGDRLRAVHDAMWVLGLIAEIAPRLDAAARRLRKGPNGEDLV